MKLTDNEIIKALECCKRNINLCNSCPIDQEKQDACTCGQFLAECALDLINRQQAEIERLKKALNTDFSFVRTRCSGKTKRINEIIKFRVETIKAEAIKEFAERLKENSGVIVAEANGRELYETKSYSISAMKLDNLVKEMTGEQ